MVLKCIPAPKIYQGLHRLEPNRKKPTALRSINLWIFIIPALFMVTGGIIWGVIATYYPTNFHLLLLGQILFMIGMFVAIILGFWVMTLIRFPQRK